MRFDADAPKENAVNSTIFFFSALLLLSPFISVFGDLDTAFFYLFIWCHSSFLFSVPLSFLLIMNFSRYFLSSHSTAAADASHASHPHHDHGRTTFDAASREKAFANTSFERWLSRFPPKYRLLGGIGTVFAGAVLFRVIVRPRQ